ncbi:hypothetical protein [Pseudomonas cannabina]|uniref:hypothetical protein n=1 Tax=Pseudomonas cannabina TaxID=86840 RepID=UPI0011C3B395|nr:hypothetical protein [Pseudomonas cannabina]
MSSQPTRQTAEELEKAFSYFNDELFEGRLPHCMITLQRQHDTFGYFSAHQFQNLEQEQVHEIALNPSFFSIRPIPETLSVLVREMVSLDQTVNAPPDKRARRRYRNKDWAARVKAVGLAPSSTGLPGGKETGDNVQTYIIADGPFDLACTRLVDEDFTLSWIDRFPPRESALLQAALNTVVPGFPAVQGLVVDGALNTQVEEGGEGAERPSQAASSPLSLDKKSGDDGVVLEPTPSSLQSGPQTPLMKRYEPVAAESLESMGIQFKEATKSANKSTFSCAICKANAWGKKSLRLMCIGTDEAPHDETRMLAKE